MGEFRVYVGAFFVAWEKWACGALGFGLGIIATFVDAQGLRVLIAILALVAFFIASFPYGGTSIERPLRIHISWKSDGRHLIGMSPPLGMVRYGCFDAS